MKLVLPLIALCLLAGLGGPAITSGTYKWVFTGIVVIALTFFLTWRF